MNGSVSNNLRIRLKGEENSRTQTLLLPESLELDGMDTALLEKGREGLEKVGFSVEEFGRNFYRIEGCPTWIDRVKRLVFCGISWRWLVKTEAK